MRFLFDEAIRLAEQQDLYAHDTYMQSAAKRQRALLFTLDGGLQEAAHQTNVNLLELTHERHLSEARAEPSRIRCAPQ